MNSTLSFGGVSLEQYLSGPVEQAEAEKRRLSLREQIKQIKRSGKLDAEAMPLKMLRLREQQAPVDSLYPQLDPSFLSMSNRTFFGNIPVDVPKFSVYRVYPSYAGPGFEVKMSYSKWNMSFEVRLRSSSDSMPALLEQPLLQSTTIYKEAGKRKDGRIYTSFQSQSDFTKWLSAGDENRGREVMFQSHLNAVVPVETKEKIKQAKRLFGKKGLFFIAETKPDAWRVSEREFTKDPLVVGVLEDTCYLIDKFDTTPLEEYVSREFTR